jgi:type IX secretion system PorP/SprF family membrane protein
MVYRSQWNNVTNAYKTISLNAETRYGVGKSNDFVTAGVQVLYDQAGTVGLNTTQILPALNYHKSINEDYNAYLSAGFMFGMVQRSINFSKATTNSSYDGMGIGENGAVPRYSYMDGSAGLCFSSSMTENQLSNFFIGVAYHHFHKPKNSFFNNENITLQPKIVGSGGIKLTRDGNAYINIQADYLVQGSSKEFIGGIMLGKKIGLDGDDSKYAVHAGAFMRMKDAFIPTIKLDMLPISVTVSYDVNISKLKSTTYGRGGMEISIAYIGFRKKNSALDAVLCPKF